MLGGGESAQPHRRLTWGHDEFLEIHACSTGALTCVLPGAIFMPVESKRSGSMAETRQGEPPLWASVIA